MLTTIIVNGTEGLRFLANLQETSEREAKPVPPALVAMIEHLTGAASTEELEQVRLEVDAPLADEIAAFVAEISGGQGTPLLFSAQVGDLVVLVREVLAEIAVGKREARTWQYLPAGTIARLVGRRGDLGKLLLLEGHGAKFPVREHAFVSDRCMTRQGTSKP